MSRLNGHGPPIAVAAVAVVIALASLAFASDWGGADARINGIERRVGILEELVGDMREDVAVIRKAVE